MKKFSLLRTRVKLHYIRAYLCHKLHHACHLLEHWFHSAYLAAVSYEAHGMYRYCAGALLVVIAISALTGGAASASGVVEEAEELI